MFALELPTGLAKILSGMCYIVRLSLLPHVHYGLKAFPAQAFSFPVCIIGITSNILLTLWLHLRSCFMENQADNHDWVDSSSSIWWIQLLGLGSQLFPITSGCWAGYLISPCLSVFISKMGIMLVPTSQVWVTKLI